MELIKQPATEVEDPEMFRAINLANGATCPKCKQPTLVINEHLGIASEKCPCGHSDTYTR